MNSTGIRQIGWSEDVIELHQLKNRWSVALDEALRTGSDEQVSRAAAMWTENAHLDLGDFGVFDGRSNIAEFLTTASKLFVWTRHFLTNPVIELDGDQAYGRWYVQLYSLAPDTGTPSSMIGVHRDRYERIERTWRLAEQITELVPGVSQ